MLNLYHRLGRPARTRLLGQRFCLAPLRDTNVAVGSNKAGAHDEATLHHTSQAVFRLFKDRVLSFSSRSVVPAREMWDLVGIEDRAALADTPAKHVDESGCADAVHHHGRASKGIAVGLTGSIKRNDTRHLCRPLHGSSHRVSGAFRPT